MAGINKNYKKLKSSYLFYNIEQRVKKFKSDHPNEHLLLLGVGDVTQPLCEEVINSLYSAVKDQSEKETFHGYMPECGAEEYLKAISKYYAARGVLLDTKEIFASSGAGDDLGDVMDLFSSDNTALIAEPTYPAYVDTNIMAGHSIIHLPSGPENGFVPMPDNNLKGDIIYICSPNNPTGAVYGKEALKAWVDYANEHQSVIIFDAAYEAFITDSDIPHSIYEIEGSKSCAIEISSLSKTAGFTGMRCGYTVIPKELIRDGMSLNDMWVRNRTTKTNGISYILQKAAAAVFTEKGQAEIKNILKIYKNNAKVLMDALDECDIPYYGGRNAPYIWMKCPDNMGSWEFFDYLLNNIHIVGTPGEGFGKCGESYFRLSAFGDPFDTAKAAERIVNEYKKR